MRLKTPRGEISWIMTPQKSSIIDATIRQGFPIVEWPSKFMLSPPANFFLSRFSMAIDSRSFSHDRPTGVYFIKQVGIDDGA